MLRKIIESHKFVFVSIILFLTMTFACKLGVEMATKTPIGTSTYTGNRLQ